MNAPSEQIVGLYERHARAWDAVRARASGFIEKVWLDRFISLLPEAAAILDIGCGSGQPIARYLIQNGFDVRGVDSSATMISLCRGRFPNQEWILADMRTLSLGRRFAGLIAWDSFFHLTYDDQRAMFPIFGAHAAPGAALLFTSGPSQSEAIGAFEGEPLYHASLDEAEYISLLGENGFRLVRRIAEDPECGGHTVLLARFQG